MTQTYPTALTVREFVDVTAAAHTDRDAPITTNDGNTEMYL